MALLETRALRRSFAASDREVTALCDVSITINRGEFVCLMGASGSGKSTLLYLLSGLDKASSGQIFYDGRTIENLDETALAVLRRDSFGFVFQNINLIPGLTIRENILIAGYLGKGKKLGNRSAVEQRCAELLEALGIAGLEQRMPAETSGGEQQRAALCRALINQPAILFADEPTGALNHAAGQSVLDCLNRIHSEGQTLVMVSHDLRTACRADRILFMRDGSVQGEFMFPATATDRQAQAREREKLLFDWLSERNW